MKTSIIIVNYNGGRYTSDCLTSFFRFHDPHSYEVIVVDNHSTDGSPEMLRSDFPMVRLLALPENRGFGPANNAGAAEAAGEILFFVNNDTLFSQETVAPLVQWMEQHPAAGIVGPRLVNNDGSFQLSFGEFPTIATERATKRVMADPKLQLQQSPKGSEPVQKDWLTGAALMMRRELFRRIGGFDEGYFMYFEDIDLCATARKNGAECWYLPSVTMTHLGGKSYGSGNPRITLEYRRSQLRYYDKFNAPAQRMMLRIFLFIKFMLQWLFPARRSAAANVLRLLFSARSHK